MKQYFSLIRVTGYSYFSYWYYEPALRGEDLNISSYTLNTFKCNFERQPFYVHPFAEAVAVPLKIHVSLPAPASICCSIVQTEAERRRREAGVKQSMEIRVRSCRYVCMWVCGYVWYLELSREPRHVAQQTRYQNVGLRNGHCLGTISSGCDF